MATLQNRLDETIKPVVEGMGYEFVGLHYLPQGKYSLLRIYIDKENGVNIDECATVSHQISGVLDVEEIISSNYTLEVSSPGIDRPLFNIEQYQNFIGNKVKINLKTMIEGKKKILGTIANVENAVIIVKEINKNNENTWNLAIDQIDRANIIADINWNKL